MTRRRGAVRILVGAAVLSGLFCPLVGRAQETVGDRAEIEAASRAFSEAYVANDIEAVEDLYTADAVLLPPGREIRGRAAAAEYFRWRSGYQQLEHAMSSDELLIRGEIAVDVGTWHSLGQRADSEPSAASGRYLVVWIRESDGRWRMRFDMWHRPTPLAQAQMPKTEQ